MAKQGAVLGTAVHGRRAAHLIGVVVLEGHVRRRAGRVILRDESAGVSAGSARGRAGKPTHMRKRAGRNRGEQNVRRDVRERGRTWIFGTPGKNSPLEKAREAGRSCLSEVRETALRANMLVSVGGVVRQRENSLAD